MNTEKVNEATPAVATKNEESSLLTASVNVSGSRPLTAFALAAGISICGYIAVKLVNKYTREKKVEITEK